MEERVRWKKQFSYRLLFKLLVSRHESISKSLDFKVNIRSNESNGDGTNGKDENSREIER